ncbi:hypothetical protein [uncultured Mesotoga sp.]|uniref:RHS repeat domain-containing protein n=1 Tax=uncultured Mesotoga sp. TaxID=1184400 RepID=UPI0025969278|nr:hypothetical protein [uncultured Mesotoga sp.]
MFSSILRLCRFLLLIFMFIGSFCGAFWVDSYLDKINTSGVKRIEIRNYNTQDGELWIKFATLTAEYDESGNTIRESKLSGDGVLEFDYSYQYDSEGNMLTMQGKRIVNDSALEHSYEYKYDENGRQIEGIQYSSDGSIISKYSAKYDESGNFVEGNDVQYDSSNSTRYLASYNELGYMTEETKYIVFEYKEKEGLQTEFRNEYQYDDLGNLLLEIGYGKYGDFSYKYGYEYDEEGNLIKAYNYSASDTIISVYEASYDDEGNLVRFILSDASGKILSEHEAQYDNGNMVLEVDCLSESRNLVYSAEYNSEGLKLKETNYNRNIGGSPLTYSYEYLYDDRGNCIQEKYFVYLEDEDQWKPITKTVYLITYYE